MLCALIPAVNCPRAGNRCFRRTDSVPSLGFKAKCPVTPGAAFLAAQHQRIARRLGLSGRLLGVGKPLRPRWPRSAKHASLQREEREKSKRHHQFPHSLIQWQRAPPSPATTGSVRRSHVLQMSFNVDRRGAGRETRGRVCSHFEHAHSMVQKWRFTGDSVGVVSGLRRSEEFARDRFWSRSRTPTADRRKDRSVRFAAGKSPDEPRPGLTLPDKTAWHSVSTPMMVPAWAASSTCGT